MLLQSKERPPAIAIAMSPTLTPDLLGPEQIARLEALGTILNRHQPITDFASDDAEHVLVEADILLTGWGCPMLDAAALSNAPRLELVAHTGSTVKPVISNEAWARGIVVTSAASANAIPVAEFAFAAILLANKGAFMARERYRAERRPWRWPWTAPGEAGNFGADIGVVGASHTGRHLLRLLSNVSCRVKVYDPFLSTEQLAEFGPAMTYEPSLAALFETSQVVSLHAPSLPETRGMISADLLARMPDGATLINTARGDLVDQLALQREVESGRLYAILDVTDPEPLPDASGLFDLPGAFVTPHIAGAAGLETRRLADLAIEEISRFCSGEALRHEVRPEMLDRIG